jgi:predicted O-linked N-acetylglucosamine transferase (SPINDLY family)
MDKFMALMGKIDVLLDPIHFGSGNTFYESMFYGVPTVTWPGQFMRGRIVAGAYQQMGIVDAPIAEQLNDYADIAVQLGGDPEKRGRLKESLRNASKESLYADVSIVRELEQFFLATLDAVDKGEKLEINWKPK